jgi:hypothetical protein
MGSRLDFRTVWDCLKHHPMHLPMHCTQAVVSLLSPSKCTFRIFSFSFGEDSELLCTGKAEHVLSWCMHVLCKLYMSLISLCTAESPSSSMSIKLESISPKVEHEELAEEEDQCTICLQPIVDRTLVPTCSHEFCFECLMVWSGTCPFSPWVMCSPPMFYFRTIQTVSTVLTKHWRPPDPPHSLHLRLSEALPAPPPYVPSPSCTPRWSAYCCHAQTPRTRLGPTRPRCPRRGRRTRTRGQSAQMDIPAQHLREGMQTKVDYILTECIVSTSPRTNTRVTARTQPPHSSQHRKTSSVE